MREFLMVLGIVALVIGLFLGVIRYGLGMWLDDDWEHQSEVTKIPGQSCYILKEYEQDEWDHDTRNYSRKVVCDK